MDGGEVVQAEFFRGQPVAVIHPNGARQFVERVVEEWRHPRYGQVPREELKVEIAYRVVFGSLHVEPHPATLRRYGNAPEDAWVLRFSETAYGEAVRSAAGAPG